MARLAADLFLAVSARRLTRACNATDLARRRRLVHFRQHRFRRGGYVRGDEPRDQARSDGEQSAAAKRDVLSRERRRDSGELTGLKLHVDRDVSHGAEAQVQDSGAFRSGRFRPIAIETVAETAAPSAGRYAD